MPKFTLSVYKTRQPLSTPYHLVFGSLVAFDTFYVVLYDGDNCGFGEVTPLPGYSTESAQSVSLDLIQICKSIEKTQNIGDEIDRLYETAPFAASGLACAVETLAEGSSLAFETPIDKPVPLTHLCHGHSFTDTVAQAKRLTTQGAKSLKFKVGIAPVEDEIDLLKAIALKVGPNIEIRIDANQSLSFEQALKLCVALEGVGIDWLEQPFKNGDWDTPKLLAEQVSMPIFLDESIWTESQIEKAKAIGMSGVKLKLSKAKGLENFRVLARHTRSLGLDLMIGNGVQTGLGNHLEFRLHAELEIECPAECNGFSKISNPVFDHDVTLKDGAVIDRGICLERKIFESFEEVAKANWNE